MAKIRVVAAGALAMTIAAAAGPSVVGAGAAAATGVGTTKASTSVLEVALGDGSLLHVRVAGEDSQATIDQKTGPASAFTRLVPLAVASKAVPALNVTAAPLEARAPGGAASVPAVTVPLDTPASTGALSLAALHASVTDAGAKSGLDSALKNLSLAGGLVAVPNLTSALGTDALTTAANGTRGLEADAITVLDLGAIIDGLGLGLGDLPVSVLSQLLSQLGLSVPGLDPGVTLDQATTTLTGAIGQVSGIITSGSLPSDPAGTVGGIIGTVGGVIGDTTAALQGTRRVQQITVPTLPPEITSVTQLVPVLNQLNLDLTQLLGNALGVLDGAALLSVRNLDVGLATTAADSLETSKATVTANVGDVLVGGKSLGGLDLGAAATQVTGLVNTVTGTLSSVLGTIDAGLANLVSVKLFEQTKDVKAAGDYRTATATLSAVTATVTPPTNLSTIVARVQGLTGVTDLVAGLGLPSLPALPGGTAVSQLESVLGNVQSLAQGATVRVASLSSTSEFVPVAAPAPSTPGAPSAPSRITTNTELPRTGGDGATYAVIGVLLLAAGGALVRWLRRPVNAL